ncbi:MAG: signal peptidase I [Spirochaetaceae bacterium]|jgi:signal peptidase I|nr:signal peptidase I [Spirochaetaceae bacterium]
MEKNAVHTGRTILLALLVAVLMKFFLFDFLIASGRSMQPAIRNGTVLVINRLAYGFRLPGTGKYLLRWSLPKTGDVVVFVTPQGSIAVKRCAELSEPPAESKSGIPPRFIALGDNSLDSYDSRSYGPVPADMIVGKVLGVK